MSTTQDQEPLVLTPEERALVLTHRAEQAAAEKVRQSEERAKKFINEVTERTEELRLNMMEELVAEGTVAQERLQELIANVLGIVERNGYIKIPDHITAERYPNLHRVMNLPHWVRTTPYTEGHPMDCRGPNCCG